jgi:hypothetical protein
MGVPTGVSGGSSVGVGVGAGAWGWVQPAARMQERKITAITRIVRIFMALHFVPGDLALSSGGFYAYYKAYIISWITREEAFRFRPARPDKAPGSR